MVVKNGSPLIGLLAARQAKPETGSMRAFGAFGITRAARPALGADGRRTKAARRNSGRNVAARVGRNSAASGPTPGENLRLARGDCECRAGRGGRLERCPTWSMSETVADPEKANSEVIDPWSGT